MPKTKKQATSSSDSDSGPEDKNPAPAKKSKGSEKDSSNSNKQDEPIWTLEKMRQVRINEFRGRRTVDIREFYEKDGKVLPGKKGIALNATQWKKLLEIAEEVTAALEG